MTEGPNSGDSYTTPSRGGERAGGLSRHHCLKPHKRPSCDRRLEAHNPCPGDRRREMSARPPQHRTHPPPSTQQETVLRNKLALDGKNQSIATKKAPFEETCMEGQILPGSGLCPWVTRGGGVAALSTLTSVMCPGSRSFKREAQVNTRAPSDTGTRCMDHYHSKFFSSLFSF